MIVRIWENIVRTAMDEGDVSMVSDDVKVTSEIRRAHLSILNKGTSKYGDIMRSGVSHILDVSLDHGALVSYQVKCKDLEIGLVEETKDSNNV